MKAADLKVWVLQKIAPNMMDEAQQVSRGRKQAAHASSHFTSSAPLALPDALER